MTVEDRTGVLAAQLVRRATELLGQRQGEDPSDESAHSPGEATNATDPRPDGLRSGPIGMPAYSQGGEYIARVTNVYLDDETGQPALLGLNAPGRPSGDQVVLVPMGAVDVRSDRLVFPFNATVLAKAPTIRQGVSVDSSVEHDVYRHFGIDPGRVPGRHRSYAGKDSAQGSERRAVFLGRLRGSRPD